MTIIQPNRNKYFLRVLVFFGASVLSVLVYAVVVYIQNVSLSHDINVRKAALENIRVENAELKNRFFQITDSSNLEKLAKEKGLVYDKNPQWVSASQF